VTWTQGILKIDMNSHQDIIARDESMHGAMFIPVVAGSDKTTVSVATGHQEYHPVYMSPGNLTNVARRSHGNALLPVAFLSIPKSESFASSSLNMI
jgi:Plavaka transposase